MSVSPPAGWFPDPEDPRRERWWTGEEWSEHRRPLPEPPSMAALPTRTGALPFVIVGFTILCVGSLAAAGAGPIAFVTVTGIAAIVIGVVALARGSLAWFRIRGRGTALIVLGAGLVLAAGTGSATARDTDGIPAADTRPVSTGQPTSTRAPTPTRTPTPTVTLEEVDEPVPFTATTVDDPNLDEGSQVVTVAGVDGVLRHTYRVTTVDGVEVGRELVSDEVVLAPVDQVTAIGTKAPVRAAPPAASGCHPSYTGACVPVGVSDVDCAGGSGNGPEYVAGPVTIVGPDEYDLDRDGDGVACE